MTDHHASILSLAIHEAIPAPGKDLTVEMVDRLIERLRELEATERQQWEALGKWMMGEEE